jgi:hypothetical protein
MGYNYLRLKYQMILVDRDEVGYEQLSKAEGFLDESK